MHLSLSFWCAIFSFTKARELSDSISSSTNAAVPWITYTSTRSCTTRPSTVFIYTSNSTTFLLPQPGPNTALTPLDSSSVGEAYDTNISVASNDGLATGTKSTPQMSNGAAGAFASTTGLEILATTTANTDGTAQSATLVPPTSNSEPSTTSRHGLGAGFSAGNGPRSGTQDSTSTVATSTSSSAPYLAAPGSTCPLPSTITVSATLPDASCASFEKTVTSYIMASCSVPSGLLETQTLVQSGRTSYITRTQQMTRPIMITYTTIESGTTAYKTSLQERTVTQSLVSTLDDRVNETLVFTTLQDGSTIYRTSLLEQTPDALPAKPTTVEDGLGYCTSLLERTVTIERTVEHTVSLGGSSPTYATIPTLQNGTTVYLTSLIEATPNPISVKLPTVTLTLWNGSTIYRTSIIERTATATAAPAPQDPITATFTQRQDGSTIYRTSIIEGTALSAWPGPSTITLTLAEGGSRTSRAGTFSTCRYCCEFPAAQSSKAASGARRCRGLRS